MTADVGFSEGRRLLAERYGQPFKIATSNVDRVINRQPIHAEDGPDPKILNITSQLYKHIQRNCLENPEGLRKIVDRLPYPLRLKWSDVVDTKKKGILTCTSSK